MLSEQLAHVLAARLEPLWQREDIVDVQPFGFGASGVWVLPHRESVVNPCMRISSYCAGQVQAVRGSLPSLTH